MKVNDVHDDEGLFYCGVEAPIYWKRIIDENILASTMQAVDEIKRSTEKNMVSNVRARFVSDWKSHRLTNHLQPIMDEMVTCSEVLSKRLYNVDLKALNFKLTISDIWVAEYEAGDHTELHNHFPSDFSSVFYFQTSEKSSPIIFAEKVEVRPESHTLIVFPGYLNHRVPRTDGRRLVIASNLHKVPTFN